MYFSLDKNSDVPVFEQIINGVCSAVREGRLGAGEQIDTEQTTAKRLGVSRPTVSKAYEKLRWMGIIESTRGRGSVIARSAYKQLGIKAYKPMRKIAYLVSAIDRMSQIPLWNRHVIYDTLEGISQRLETTIATLSYICIGRQDRQEPMSAKQLETLKYQLKEFDGVLLLAEPASADAVIPLIQKANLPCVRLYNTSKTKTIPHVIYDRAGAVKMGVEHLIKQGYQRIGYIGVDDRKTDGKRAKYSAFFEALDENGKTAQQEDIWLVNNHDARSAVEEHLKRNHSTLKIKNSTSNLPDAFFIGSDYYAMQALSVFQFAGISIPDDLSIMSYDDVNETTLINPPLTTVHIPRHSIGYTAANLLFSWPIQGAAPESKTLHADISERESVKSELIKSRARSELASAVSGFNG